ncbi:MAG: site-specific integrase, partial [Chloroflexota bacterium]|nr:site-specific integrase [Chloroflexota bacterium]
MSVDSLVAQYLDCLKTEGKSPYTVRWHRASLGQFAAWVRANDHPEDPTRWSTAMLRGYIVHQRERPAARGGTLSESGLNSLIRSLRAFCTWLHEEDWVDRDLFARVTIPRAPRLVKDTLSAADVGALVDAARSNRRNALRNEALLH